MSGQSERIVERSIMALIEKDPAKAAEMAMTYHLLVEFNAKLDAIVGLIASQAAATTALNQRRFEAEEARAEKSALLESAREAIEVKTAALRAEEAELSLEGRKEERRKEKERAAAKKANGEAAPY